MTRAIWSAGNWDRLSRHPAPAGPVVIDAAGVQAGMDVLDVGCGSGGTIAVPAAQRGARVTGADIAPENFSAARARAEAAGVQVEWIEADAAAIPLPDASFDRVLSTFGHAFAPDQEGAARELVRLCRPGGRIACAMWTPEGVNGQMFSVVGRHMPAPPEGFVPPIAWGTEARWEELVGSQGVELEFRRADCPFEGRSLDAFLDEFAEFFGPLVTARNVLGEEGFAALKADLRELFGAADTGAAGGFRMEAEYLIAIGARP
jgi:SAM-dependent methyltransferase